jgi:hypothetical protein
MSRYIGAATVFCMFLFVLGCVGVFTYQFVWVAPAERCEKAGRWWLDERRLCGIPIEISKITGRPNPPAPGAGQAPRGAPANDAVASEEAASATGLPPKG